MSRPDSTPVLVLFRDDLRLSDHPALHAAAASGRPVLCAFVFDQESPGVRPLGGAARWWLHGSLASLAGTLAAIGGRLDLFRGATASVVPAIAAAAGVSACFFHRRYGAGERAADDAMISALADGGVEVHAFNGSLLHEPGEVRTKSDGRFRVFSPYLRAALALGPPTKPLPRPERLTPGPQLKAIKGQVTLEALGLLPTKPDWAGGLRETWTPGEPAAQARLETFLTGSLSRYGDDRNRPALPGTSRLSPHLRHGDISPRQVLARVLHAADAGTASREQVEKFTAEVIWRDFAYDLLDQHPDLATEPVQRQFEAFPYHALTSAERHAWEKGHTGYPIVDAGMRQLWRTGVMHNRVRMITASFLVKHLLADWRIGEEWFWDTLCDADPANNPVNWQWVAGCGIDPSPYFRIFNPVLQGEKFDPEGTYVRAFVPELSDLPARWIHKPWEAPPAVLEKAGVTLGTTYPRPIVEHGVARARALKALATMREQSR